MGELKPDTATEIRKGEAFDFDQLQSYLDTFFGNKNSEMEVLQFPSGYSNLTYLVRYNDRDYVIRRPPFGAKIKSGHDMSREFNILSGLRGHFSKAPKPILFCEDESVIGANFYMMEKVSGIILRGNMPREDIPKPEQIQAIVVDFVDTLNSLHRMDYKAAGLENFGKPDGYVRRQVEGWIFRYEKSKTHDHHGINTTMKWLNDNYPQKHKVSLIHNDFKYDNLVLSPDENLFIKAVLDWEMATIGDPLMDLGTTLGYWIHESDPDFIRENQLNLSSVKGNPKRGELVQMYAAKSGEDLDGILFYFVFGLFKIAVIVQQIFYRYQKGFTQDPRFKDLDKIVELYGIMAQQAISKKRIDDLF